VLKKDFTFDGVYACPDEGVEGNCYVDYDKVAGMGVPGKTDAVVVATDYKNWSVVYMCREKWFGLKNDWIWIVSRHPTLSEELLQEAKDALLEKYPDFDMNRLVTVTQG